jgi:hypothetical protein
MPWVSRPRIGRRPGPVWDCHPAPVSQTGAGPAPRETPLPDPRSGWNVPPHTKVKPAKTETRFTSKPHGVGGSNCKGMVGTRATADPESEVILEMEDGPWDGFMAVVRMIFDGYRRTAGDRWKGVRQAEIKHKWDGSVRDSHADDVSALARRRAESVRGRGGGLHSTRLIRASETPRSGYTGPNRRCPS